MLASLGAATAQPGAAVLTRTGAADTAAQDRALPAIVNHRAVYDLRLGRATHASGVAALSGRMVLKITGAACDGWRQQARLVTRTITREGAVLVSDIRGDDWEADDGSRFQFSSKTLLDGAVIERASGQIERADNRQEWQLQVADPVQSTATVRGPLVFPIALQRRILAAAKANQNGLSLPYFDGTPSDGPLRQLARVVIGRGVHKSARGAERPAQTEPLVWPVAMSHFPVAVTKGAKVRSERGQIRGLPDAEVEFEMRADGAALGLTLTYPGVQLRGRLADLRVLPQPPCG